MPQEIAVIGLDLAKNVFQLHAIAHDGSPVLRRQLRRAEVLKFFAKAEAAMPCRDGSLCISLLLGPGDRRARA